MQKYYTWYTVIVFKKKKKKGGVSRLSLQKKDIGCVFYETSVSMINITDSTSATHKRMLHL